MATENPTLSALDEQVSPAVAEDVQAAPEVTVEVAEPETAETTVEVDFSDDFFGGFWDSGAKTVSL